MNPLCRTHVKLRGAKGIISYCIEVHSILGMGLNEVVLEIRAAQGTNKIFDAQVLTYLRAMNKKAGLLINFNVLRLKEGIKRLIL